MKVVHIVGARPQFIKYFSIYKAIQDLNLSFDSILVHTGQHYDYQMSEIFFKQLGLNIPKYHLEVGSGTHGYQTGKMLERTEEVLFKEKPDVVVVYGDTNSTLSGALAAIKLFIPIVHVEAGLRSFNKKMPEEINRVLTDHCSTILLCPTKNAVKNLEREGFTNIYNSGELIPLSNQYSFNLSNSNPFVVNVGDVMFDVVLYSLDIASKFSNILSNLRIESKSYNVMTLHRAENTDDISRLQFFLEFVSEFSKNLITIFPIHPRTKKVIEQNNLQFSENIKVIEPVGYFDMLWLVKNSQKVFTDSGGLQKEAYWLEVPCITLREETEWIETIESGWNVLYKNYNGKHTFLGNRQFYGDGEAGKRIAKILNMWRNPNE